MHPQKIVVLPKKLLFEIAAVQFIPKTSDVKLIEMIRKKEETISKQSGYRVKYIELA